MKPLFNSSNSPKVCERGFSLTKGWKSYSDFIVFDYGVTLTSRTLAQYVSTHLENESSCSSLPLTLLQVLIFGVYGSRIFLDGVVASTMCYMLYKRSSGFTARSNAFSVILMQSTDTIPCQQWQHCKDCAWAYSMVDFNWRVNVVCAAILFSYKFYPNHDIYWVQDG